MSKNKKTREDKNEVEISRRSALKKLGIGGAALVGGAFIAGDLLQRTDMANSVALNSQEAKASQLVTNTSTSSVVFPYDFLVYQVKNVYYAQPSFELGLNLISNNTPDIWALFNSIDAVTPLDYTSIFVKNGIYTGSSTFNIGAAGRGYGISGVGWNNASPGTSGTMGGTQLEYTGTGSAINTPKWTSAYPKPALEMRGQNLNLKDLSILASETKGSLVNLPYLDSAIWEHVRLIASNNTSSTVKPGSIGLSMPGPNNNSQETLIKGNCFFAGFDTCILSRIDHLRVIDCEAAYWGSHFLDIEPISGGGPIYNYVGRVHSFDGGVLNNGSMIYDNRALFSYAVTQAILVMDDIANETPQNGNPNYTNVQGAYYVARLPNLNVSAYGSIHYETNLPGAGAKSPTDKTGSLMKWFVGTNASPYVNLSGSGLTATG